MSPRKKAAKSGRAKSQEAIKAWSQLTWDDLHQWSGDRSVARGQAYQRQGRVTHLSLSEDGRLLATVNGSHRYVTSAWLEPGRDKRKRPDSVCTCPVGASGCKHAVAVVAEFLAALADVREVPAADPDDPRWAKLSGDTADDVDDFDADDDSWDDEPDAEDEVAEAFPPKKCSRPRKASTTKRRTRAEWDKLIQTHLGAKGREELAELIMKLVGRFPELREEFQERILLGEGDVDQLVAAAHRELRSVTAEPGWTNHWNSEGYTPNYGPLKRKLERLVELGHCDQVVELGRELMARGIEQVGQSDDEGDTAGELSRCLEVVFAALAKSSLSPPEKILYAIDACLQDDYDIVGESATEVLDGKWSQADWSEVADRLAKRLGKAPAGNLLDDFNRKYQRDCLTSFLADALDRAGRGGELLAIYEAEAGATGSYQRLVSHLIESKRFEEAERWAREGIEKTISKYPGIASRLATSMCDLAKQRKQWDVVAAHAAHEFFDRPSSQTFKALAAAAKKAGCQKDVCAAAQRFLETGASPVRVSSDGKRGDRLTIDSSWPLPVPGCLRLLMLHGRHWGLPGPHFDVLLDMAIAEKRPADVLRWYEESLGSKKQAGRASQFGHWPCESNRVAQALAAAYPERALEIYQGKLEALLPQTGNSAYEACAECLRQMRPIFKSLNREDHWSELLADLRHNYRNRPRFMEVLDRLEGKTIVKSLKSPRRQSR